MKKLFTLVAVALTLCGLLTACGSKTETTNDVDLTGFYNTLAERIRSAIETDTFAQFRAEYSGRLAKLIR